MPAAAEIIRFSMDDPEEAPRIDGADWSKMDKRKYQKKLDALRAKYNVGDDDRSFAPRTNPYTKEPILTKEGFDRYLRELAYHQTCEEYYDAKHRAEYNHKLAEERKAQKAEFQTQQQGLRRHYHRCIAALIVVALVLSVGAILRLRGSAAASARSGYDSGYAAGVEQTRTAAYDDGYAAGYDQGKTSGYQSGFRDGKQSMSRSDTSTGSTSSINSGLQNVIRSAGGEVAEEEQQPAAEYDYVLNLSTHKFHKPGCASVSQMNAENRSYFTGTRDEVIAMGYSPCGRCKP